MKLKKFEKRVLMSPPHMSGEEMKYIKKAFDDNWIVPLGPNVDQFETDIKNYLGEDVYPVAMNSGTSAIHIALILLGIEKGDEVFCSSLTFIASANPILYLKATPVFIDSEKDTWNICPESLKLAIENKKKTGKIPKAIIVADLFGMSAKYDEISKICDENNIKIIEDSAESLGSSYKNRKCGVFGEFGILSFNGNKIITTSGGGILVTHNKEQAQRAIHLITQARMNAPYYLHEEVGYNYRMSNICAGIGIAQLNVLDERVSSRRRINQRYRDNLSYLPINFLFEKESFQSNYWLTTALLDDPKLTPSDLIEKLNKHNVESRHIWKPLHTQPLMKDFEFFSTNDIPIANKIFNNGICLPSGSLLADEDVDQISNIIKSSF